LRIAIDRQQVGFEMQLEASAIMCLGTLVGFNKYFGTFSATRFKFTPPRRLD